MKKYIIIYFIIYKLVFYVINILRDFDFSFKIIKNAFNEFLISKIICISISVCLFIFLY